MSQIESSGVQPFGLVRVLEPEESLRRNALLTAIDILHCEANQILRDARPLRPQVRATPPVAHGPVRPGQIWTDGDPTSTRRITVEGLDRDHAICRSSRGNLQVRIRLNRFVPGTRGYRLVQDAPAE